MSKIEEIIKSRAIPYIKLKEVEGHAHYITSLTPRHRPANGKFAEYNGYDVLALECENGFEFKYTAPTTLINIINEIGSVDEAIEEFHKLNSEGKGILLTQSVTSDGTQYYAVNVTENF